MKIETGGTDMWCPKCEKITTCKAVQPRDVNRFISSSRRSHKKEHVDVRFFRRGRICLVCQHKFLTAEAREDFLTELVELRDALAAIKRDAEQYIVDSQQTGRSLSSLNESLSKLRALEIYQNHEPGANPRRPPKTVEAILKKLEGQTPPTSEELRRRISGASQ